MTNQTIKELKSLAKEAKRFKNVEEFEKGFIEITKSKVFKEAISYQSYTDISIKAKRIVSAVKKFPDALKILTENTNIVLPPKWTGKVLTELSGFNLEKTLLRIEKGLNITKNKSATLQDFYFQATKTVKKLSPIHSIDKHYKIS